MVVGWGGIQNDSNEMHWLDLQPIRVPRLSLRQGKMGVAIEFPDLFLLPVVQWGRRNRFGPPGYANVACRAWSGGKCVRSVRPVRVRIGVRPLI